MGSAVKSKGKETGATTLELAIFSAISVLILIGVYDAYRNFLIGMIRTQTRAMTQDNVRRVFEQALRELRMAGYGLTTIAALVPLSAITTASIDSVTFLTNEGAASTTLATAANAGSTSLSVASTSGFQLNDGIYVTDGTTYHAATVTAVGASPAFSPPLTGDFSSGATVELQARQITYSYTGEDPVSRRGGRGRPPTSAHPYLVREFQLLRREQQSGDHATRRCDHHSQGRRQITATPTGLDQSGSGFTVTSEPPTWNSCRGEH